MPLSSSNPLLFASAWPRSESQLLLLLLLLHNRWYAVCCHMFVCHSVMVTDEHSMRACRESTVSHPVTYLLQCVERTQKSQATLETAFDIVERTQTDRLISSGRTVIPYSLAWHQSVLSLASGSHTPASRNGHPPKLFFDLALAELIPKLSTASASCAGTN